MTSQQDWFATNAPKSATPSASGDWFAENRPQQQPDFRVEVKASEAPFMWADLERKGRPGSAYGQSRFGTALADAFIGALKGGGQTAVNLGRFMHLVPGVTEAVDWLYGDEGDQDPRLADVVTGAAPRKGLSARAFEEADRLLTPTNTAQKIGKGAEQLAEVIVPSKALATAGAKATAALAPKLAPVVGQTVAKLAPRVAVEAAATGAMAAAQGGDPVTGAVMGAAGPIIGATASKAAPWLKKTAVDKTVQALGPTKERFKAIAKRIAPEMMKRGLKGSREALQAQAAAMVKTTGEAVDSALLEFGEKRVATDVVLDALEQAKAPYRRMVFNPRTGAEDLEVIFDKRPIQQLAKLQEAVRAISPYAGGQAKTEHLVALRRAWDDVVDQAGGFAHRAPGQIGVPLKEQSEAWAKREGRDAIRQLLADAHPNLDAVNKEFSFWKNINDVVTQTLQRSQPQKQGRLAQKIGAAAGIVTGDSLLEKATGVALWGKGLQLLDRAINSPRWALADARLRNRIADALMSGNESELAAAVSRVTAVEGSKLPAMFQSSGVR